MTYTPAGKPIRAEGNLYVLAVGINEYKDTDLTLKGPVNDVASITQAFQKGCKGDLFGEIRPYPLTDTEATRNKEEAAE